MKTKAESITFGLILIYLTCYFAHIFRFPDLLMLVLGAIFCLILLLKQKKLRIDIGLCLLTITMFAYCISKFGIRAIVIMMPYIPMVMYILANYLAAEIKHKEQPEVKLTYIVYSLVFGFAIYGILNSYMYFAGTGLEGTRYWVDFWTQQLTPGTQLTIYYLPVLSIVFPTIIYFYRRKLTSAVIAVLTVFFIYASLATRTRTTLLVLGLVFCGQVVLYAILEKEKVMKGVTPKKAGIFLGCIVAVIAVLVFILKDNEIVQAFIANLGKDGGILNNVRFQAQAEVLKHLFEYPMGGSSTGTEIHMAHNVWLDMANSTGLIPFFAFAAYTFWTIYELIRFVFKKGIDTEIKLIIAGIYVAFFLYYTVEPALDASIHFMTPWMLVNGLVHGYLSKR